MFSLSENEYRPPGNLICKSCVKNATQSYAWLGAKDKVGVAHVTPRGTVLATGSKACAGLGGGGRTKGLGAGVGCIETTGTRFSRPVVGGGTVPTVAGVEVCTPVEMGTEKRLIPLTQVTPYSRYRSPRGLPVAPDAQITFAGYLRTTARIGRR